MKGTIKENKELILENENLMLQKENNVEQIDFEFPDMINGHSIEKFRKYIEIETEDKSVVDEIFNDTYYLKRTITKYSSINIQIVLIYEEKDIVFKTTKRILMFDESINADEKLSQEEQSLLYKMSEKVNKLENYDDTEIKNDIENLQTNKVDKVENKDLSTNDFTNEYKEKLDNLENYDDTEVKQNISNLQENISDIQNDNIEQSKKIEDIEQEQSTQNENIETNKNKILELEEKHNKEIANLESLVPVRTSTRRKYYFE